MPDPAGSRPEADYAASPLLLVYGAMIGHGLISGGTHLLGKTALGEFAALELVWLRIVASGLLWAALLLAMRIPLLPPRRAIGQLALFGLLGVVLNQGLYLSGLEYTKATHAPILYALTPVLVVIGSRVFLGERISRVGMVAVSVAVTGAMVILLQRGHRSANAWAPDPLLGDLIILCAVCCWTSYTILGRPLAQRHGAVAITGQGMMAAAVIALPFGPFVVRPPGEFATLTPAAWSAFAYLVLGTSVVAFFLWSYGLRTLAASRVAIFANLQPVSTAILAWAIVGEQITLATTIGGVLVIAGVTVLNLPARRRATADGQMRTPGRG